MKKIKIIPLILLLSLNIQAQTEIENESQSQQIQAIPYDGSFMKFESGFSEEKKAGVVGETVTLVDVGYYFIFDGEKALKNNKFITADEAHKFRNKTFVVIGYSYDSPDDILTIKNENGIFLWKISDLSTYVFNRYLDTLKSNIEGKRFIPLYDNEKLKSLDGKLVEFNGAQSYSISKVKFTKIQRKYWIVLTINGSFHFIYPTGENEQPGYYKGDIYAREKNWINIQSNEAHGSKVTLIEENTYKKFAEDNKEIIKDIRNRKVKIGHD